MLELLEFVRAFAQARSVSDGYIHQIKIAVKLYSQFLGRQATTADLAAVPVNLWLADLEADRAAETVNGRRRNLLILWRAAHEAGHVAEFPRKIRLAKGLDREIEGFSADDARSLLAHAETLSGDLAGWPIAKRDYWSSFLRFDWDTAFRLGDVLSFERSWIWPGGRVSHVQHKTGQRIAKQLQPETVAAIERSFDRWPDRALIWPQWGRRECWYKAFRQLVKGAGLRGTSKWIRRGSATAVELATPGLASAHLGHRTLGLARKSYLITRLMEEKTIAPPKL